MVAFGDMDVHVVRYHRGVTKRIEAELGEFAYSVSLWIGEVFSGVLPVDWREQFRAVLAEETAQGHRVTPESAAATERWIERFAGYHGLLPKQGPEISGDPFHHVTYASAGLSNADESPLAASASSASAAELNRSLMPPSMQQMPLSTKDPLGLGNPPAPADQEKLDDLNLEIDHQKRKREREERTEAEQNAQMKDILLGIAGVVVEPLDWAMTGHQIATDPKNPVSYAGLLPLVPAGTGKIFRIMDKGGDAAKAAAAATPAPPKGGTYVLRDPEADQVMRTGRTKDLARRQSDHFRDSATKDLKFEIDRQTDIYAQQRGREQIIHDEHRPPMNKINPIDPKNPDRQKFLDAAEGL